MTEIYVKRIERIRRNMGLARLDALLITEPQSIFYTTGIWNDPYERMYVFYLPFEGKPVLFANKLFRIPKNTVQTVWYSDADDSTEILAKNLPDVGRIGVDKLWTASFLLPLQEKKKGLSFTLGSHCVDDERGCKDETEIALMKEASRINDVCIEKAFKFIHAGITEKEVADYINRQFRAEGADGPSFTTIVSFGANAADPHHEPDNTVIQDGDCILIDMGCIKDGYCSDMTRTSFYAMVGYESKSLYELVLAASQAAEEAVKPGVYLADIDKIARDIISKGGYGEYFTHRLGHFCGQRDHEEGEVSAKSKLRAKEGMIFSIEPGIYLPGKIGIRIEDLVLVTANGVEVLNHVDKKISVIA